MRVLNILLILVLGVASANAEEITVNLDQVALLIPDQEDWNEYSSRIAIHFTLPEEVAGKEIIYTELFIPLSFADAVIVGDSVLEIQAFNIATDWTEENASWDYPWTEPGGDIDSLSSYSFAIKMKVSEDVHLDVSRFVRSVVEDGQFNYGLMLIPLKYDQPVFHFYSNIDSWIRNVAEVRLTYK